MTLIRLCFTIAIVVFATLQSPNAFAQANRDGDDQPGLIANPDDEQLDPKWQKTVVFYRTTEAPGTIIVHTNERYLYVVQPGGPGAALRHRRRPRRLPVAGPASRSRRKRNGRTGRRPRK